MKATDLIIVFRIAALRLLDRAVDHILGARVRLCLFHRKPQARVLLGVRVAHLGSHGDFLGQLGKQLGAQFVLPALAVLDIRPFGMARHGKPLVISGLKLRLYRAWASLLTRARSVGSQRIRRAPA
jgi:hypothetical protein